ncbi:MAG: hypothetical protein HY646_11710 [Acidobacteria bacterium]|nr:hypothetical protein [Acidobacteriota bacterium]
MLSRDFRRMVAVALALTTTFITMPVSAADFPAAKPVIGSVSVSGPVQLRGVAISQEGTLFAGDSIRSLGKGYAKVSFTGGNKIEMDQNAQVQVTSDKEGTRVLLAAGNIGFSAAKATTLRMAVQPFEIVAAGDAGGNVVVQPSGIAGVRTTKGKVTVRNLKTSESFVLLKGEERLLYTTTGKVAKPLGQIASAGPIPALPPQGPAGQTGGGAALDTGAWIAIAAGAAVGGIAIAALVMANNNDDDIDSLNAEITTLRTSLSTATSQFTSLQTTVTGLQASLTTANANIATANTNITGLRNTLNTVQANLTTTQNAVAALQTLSAIQSNSAALQSAIQEAITAVQASNLSAAQKATLLANLQTQLSEARSTQATVARLAAGAPGDIASTANINLINTLAVTANTQVTAAADEITRVATNPAVVAAGILVPTPPQLPATTPVRVGSASIPE